VLAHLSANACVALRVSPQGGVSVEVLTLLATGTKVPVNWYKRTSELVQTYKYGRRRALQHALHIAISIPKKKK
jgi:hypothetical protein